MCKNVLGSLIKKHREKRGVSQDDLSKVLGFAHRSQVHRLETGKTDWKAVDFVKAADSLDISDGEIMEAIREGCLIHR